jgi:hypothetical protein
MLKKLFVAFGFLLAASASFAQQVVQLNPQSSSFVVVKTVPFGNYVSPGIQYVFPIQPQNAVTVLVKTSGTGSSALGMSLYCTVDPTDSPANPSQTWIAVPTTLTVTGNPTIPNSINPFPVAGGILTPSITGTTTFIVQSSVTGASQCALLLNQTSAVSTLLLTVTASVSPATPYMNLSSLDPCMVLYKNSAPINIVAAGNVQIIPANSPSQQIYICGYTLNFIGASQTAAFAPGSAGSCAATGTAASGAMGPGTAVSEVIANNADGALLIFSNTQPACIIATGTTVNIQGHVTYVYH